MKKQCILILILMMASSMTIAYAEGEIILRQAVIVDLVGKVDVKKDTNSDWEAAAKGMTLSQDARIKTGEDGKAVLELKDSSGKEDRGTVNMAVNTEMSISELKTNESEGKEKTRLNLAMGKVLIKAKEVSGDSEFEVQTPTAVAGVWGTEFEVAVAEEK